MRKNAKEEAREVRDAVVESVAGVAKGAGATKRKNGKNGAKEKAVDKTKPVNSNAQLASEVSAQDKAGTVEEDVVGSLCSSLWWKTGESGSAIVTLLLRALRSAVYKAGVV